MKSNKCPPDGMMTPVLVRLYFQDDMTGQYTVYEFEPGQADGAVVWDQDAAEKLKKCGVPVTCLPKGKNPADVRIGQVKRLPRRLQENEDTTLQPPVCYWINGQLVCC